MQINLQAVIEGYVELLTTLFMPIQGGYDTIQFYCRCCGGELDGTQEHHPMMGELIDLYCPSCDWKPTNQDEARYELLAALIGLD